jgi:hypothetical protein
MSLAYRQSYGFFDNIDDGTWQRAQQIHSKMFPNHYGQLSRYSVDMAEFKRSRDKTKLATSNWWNGENFQEEFHCPLAQRLPTDSQADGPKWVCDPHRLRAPASCLVYSFGSNGKAEFEKGVTEEIGQHCEIHTFDMNNYNRRYGDFATALRGYSTFHQWGLGTEDQARRQPNTYKTLDQTVRELGHTNRTINIFKIDCEWCEWDTYRDWLDYDIRQILVETHNAPMPNAQQFFFELHDAGFVIFSKEANYQNGAGCAEYGFLKLSTDFFVNGTMYRNLSK